MDRILKKLYSVIPHLQDVAHYHNYGLLDTTSHAGVILLKKKCFLLQIISINMIFHVTLSILILIIWTTSKFSQVTKTVFQTYAI